MTSVYKPKNKHSDCTNFKRFVYKSKETQNKDWPVVIYLWIIGLAVTSYVIARMALNGYPHSYHWLSAVAGGVAGIPLGWLWYRWRGDVF